MSLVPVYVYEEGDELPAEGNYYVIANNGNFLHKDAGIVQGLVKVDDIPALGKLDVSMRLNLPKLPVELLFRCLVFFRRVWYEHRSEAALVLFYHKERQEYFLHCPQQQVANGSVDYGIDDEGNPSEDEKRFQSEMRAAGYRKVGTIHSHCNFSAFHSFTDIGDERNFDGIHITIGHVNQTNFSLSISLAVHNNRLEVDAESVCSGIAKYSVKSAFPNTYDFTFSEEKREAIVNQISDKIDSDWMPLVTKLYGHKRRKGRSAKHLPPADTQIPHNPLGWVPDPLKAANPSPDKELAIAANMCRLKAVNEFVWGPATILPPKVEEPSPAKVEEPQPMKVEEPSLLSMRVENPLSVKVEEPQVLADDAEMRNFLREVQQAAKDLSYHWWNMPEEIKNQKLELVTKFFNNNLVTSEILESACNIDPERPIFYKEKGYTVK